MKAKKEKDECFSSPLGSLFNIRIDKDSCFHLLLQFWFRFFHSDPSFPSINHLGLIEQDEQGRRNNRNVSSSLMQ